MVSVVSVVRISFVPFIHPACVFIKLFIRALWLLYMWLLYIDVLVSKNESYDLCRRGRIEESDISYDICAAVTVHEIPRKLTSLRYIVFQYCVIVYVF